MVQRTSLVENADFVVSLPAANRTTTGTGAGVDVAGTTGATAVFHLGTSTQALTTTVTITAILQHSDASDTGFVATTQHTGQIAGAADGAFVVLTSATGNFEKNYVTAYTGTRRYLRVVDSRAGTQSTGVPSSAHIVKQVLYNAPKVTA